MRTPQILAKLKAMATQTGEALFERVGLAARVLADKAWIDSACDCDADKALALVEAECFPELSLAFGLSNLLTLLRVFPDKATWQSHNFNVRFLWAEHVTIEKANRGDSPKAERRTATVAELDENKEKIKELEWTVKSIRDNDEAQKTEIERLRQENAELRGELRALTKVVEQFRMGRTSAA